MKTRTDIKKIEWLSSLRKALAWSYRKLSSIETSVWLLSLLAISFMVGTIFPQGGDFDEYVKEGGRFVLLVEAFDLLAFFSSPLFLAIALLFVLNLVICTCERYKALFAKRRFPESFAPTKSFLVTQDAIRAHDETRRILNDSLGFRLVDKDSAWIVMEKGLPYRWLTWAYHAGLVVCLIGVLFTFLFAFEDTITLKTGSPQTVIPTTTGRVQYIWQNGSPQTDYHLLLDSFTTEYEESHELDYPDDRKARLAMGLGWKMPEHKMSVDPLFATDWKAKLKIIGGSSTLAEKEIEINEPLKYGGYTFYLMGFEQRLKLRVNDSFMPLDVKADDDVIIPGSMIALSLGTLRTGKAKRLDGTIDELTPYVTVKDSASKDEPAILKLNESIIVDGNIVTLIGFTEQAILSYRYDPGVTILWIGGIIALVALFLRLYGSYYLLAYKVDDADAIVTVNFNITSKGLLASPEHIENRIEELLTAGDLKPLALPEQT